VNKSALREAILHELGRELTAQLGAAHLAREEAISEESKPENKYDTHSQEAAYLAEGQARIAADINESMKQYASLPLPIFDSTAPIALGALVEIGGSIQDSAWYFLGPRAGGIELQAEGKKILVVTPQSPLGRQLLGRRAGDSVALPGRKAREALTILTVT
jgi:transcription elongation GreA/GreB family factor